MPSHEELVGAEKYLFSREMFRDRARTEFFSKRDAKPLVELINDYVARAMFALSGQDLSTVPHAEYVSDLTVSFTRTHFIVIDLIVCSELIDSATLLRKQFELLARLHELDSGESVSNLLNKTPNLKILRTNIKRLYGEYSRIAHSAHPEPLQLLGRIEDGEKEWTPVYPMFADNSYIALQHAFVSVVEYYLWVHPFLSRHSQAYDAVRGQTWMDRALIVHDTTYGEDKKG